MPSDLQLIDGFEALRTAFLSVNPSVALDPVAGQEPVPMTAEAVLTAWWRARLDLDGDTPQERRWLRALVNLPIDPSRRTGLDPGLAALLKKHPKAPDQALDAAEVFALMAKDGCVRPPVSGRPHAAEAAAWAAAVPGLTGLRAWAFMAHLGRAPLVPSAAVRRFLWRLGLIESDRVATPEAFAPAASAIEQIARATGFTPRALSLLVNWHVEARPGLAGSGRCGRKPRCESCPFEGSCAFHRFRGSSSSWEGGSSSAAETELALLRRMFDAPDRAPLEPEELVALMIGPAAGRTPLEAASRLLRLVGGVRGLDHVPLRDLMEAGGISEARARSLKAALELGRRAAEQPLSRGDGIEGSADVWAAFRNRFQHIPQEHFIVLMLDARNRVIDTCFVSKGSLTGSLAHPREVFKQAVLRSASGVILMHNHPSGDASPSREDAAITRRLSESGEILGIRVLDHIILGHDAYYSFKDEGRL